MRIAGGPGRSVSTATSSSRWIPPSCTPSWPARRILVCLEKLFHPIIKETPTGFGQHHRDQTPGANRSEKDGMNHFARKPEESVEAWVVRLEETDPPGLSEADQLLYRECLA